MANAQKVALKSVGGFDLVEKIGDSGMGAVYKGINWSTGQIVAVKLMPPFQSDKELTFQRFARECRILTSLNDPHIVRALDFGIEGSSAFLVLEFVAGESLLERIARDGKLPEAEAVRLIGEVAGALDRAHDKGLVHRNVKPDKILVTREGKAKLNDLSLVRQVETQQDLTRAGTTLGTPNFMAPEQLCNASKATKHGDLYSLAATLYMALTGELPFGESNLAEMWAKKLANDLPPPSKLVPELSARIDRAIKKAMSTKPEDRHATCDEFIKDLTGTGEPEARAESVKPAADQPQPDPAPAPVPRLDVASSKGMRLFTDPAATEHYGSEGADFSLMGVVVVTLVVVVGFLSGLSLFAH